MVTVGLEDYFHVGAFNRLIQHGEWYRFETRLEQGVTRTLELLEHHRVRATFFVLGWVADQAPEMVRRIAERGHEIASKGYYHRGIGGLTPAEFRDDLTRAREALESASGQSVRGYRLADQWFGPEDIWALEVLADQGYRYDSSIAPLGRRFASQPWRRFAHVEQFGEKVLWEFPIPTASVLGFLVPIGGGNYFRQFPESLLRRAVARWVNRYTAPFVMYFHTWELDPDQPRISAAPRLQRLRHYRNLDRYAEILGYYLARYRFTSAADYLGLEQPDVAPERAPPEPRAMSVATVASPDGAERGVVTVVVPCYNEELILPYLANTLHSVRARLAPRYDLRFVFVDDASTDGTWEALQRLFGDQPGCRLVRHPVNRGVTAGILTGVRAADSEVVCSIDCDCTYDPHELERMLPLLEDGVAMVTASPYHPDGAVRNVPRWRLALSRTLSRLYRLVLRNQLATYTSCFRVYRRSAVVDLHPSRNGFLGVAELLGRLDLDGAHIAEFPTTLEVRLLGRSKMKILRTIVGHLGLLGWLAARRFRAARAGTAASMPGDAGA